MPLRERAPCSGGNIRGWLSSPSKWRTHGDSVRHSPARQLSGDGAAGSSCVHDVGGEPYRSEAPPELDQRNASDLPVGVNLSVEVQRSDEPVGYGSLGIGRGTHRHTPGLPVMRRRRSLRGQADAACAVHAMYRRDYSPVTDFISRPVSSLSTRTCCPTPRATRCASSHRPCRNSTHDNVLTPMPSMSGSDARWAEASCFSTA